MGGCVQVYLAVCARDVRYESLCYDGCDGCDRRRCYRCDGFLWLLNIGVVEQGQGLLFVIMEYLVFGLFGEFFVVMAR